MPASKEHQAWADELGQILALWPRVRMQKMMGSYAIMTGTRMFGFPWQGGLVLKVDAATRERLLKNGRAKAFEMRGRPFGEWIRIDVQNPRQMRLALETLQAAQEHAEATPPRKRSSAPRRRTS